MRCLASHINVPYFHIPLRNASHAPMHLLGLHLCHSLVSFSPFIHSSVHPFIHPFITNPCSTYIPHAIHSPNANNPRHRLRSTGSFASILLSSPKIIYLNPITSTNSIATRLFGVPNGSRLCRSTTGRTLLTNYEHESSGAQILVVILEMVHMMPHVELRTGGTWAPRPSFYEGE